MNEVATLIQRLKPHAADPQNETKMQKYEKCKNENRQKLVILEGFGQNGLQIRIQRNFLRISTPVKIIFRHFFENDIF